MEAAAEVLYAMLPGLRRLKSADRWWDMSGERKALPVSLRRDSKVEVSRHRILDLDEVHSLPFKINHRSARLDFIMDRDDQWHLEREWALYQWTCHDHPRP